MLFIHSFLNGLALVYFETTASTLFLSHYTVGHLPYVYILSAVVSVILGFLYTKVESKIDVKKLLYITLLFILSAVLFFFISIKYFEAKELYLWIMVFKDILWIFIGMEFGILIGIIFNIRKGKKLFGIVMSGEILASILGGVSVGFLVKYIETINLLVISSFSLLLSFVLLYSIIYRFSMRFTQNEQESEDEDDTISYKQIFSKRYYLLIFVISALSLFVFYFIDYIFYYKVEQHYPDEKELASFFGIFFAMLSSVNLFSSLFASGALLNRFGIVFGLAAIPAMALFGTSALLVISSFSIVFIVLVGVKLLDEVFDISLLTPVFRVLYQAIPTKQRVQVLTFRETIIEPTAMGLVGVLLLLFSEYKGIDFIYYIIIVLSIGWIFTIKFLNKEYIHSLEQMIYKKNSFSDDMLLSGVNEKFLLQGLETENEVQILYYLRLLEKFHYKEIYSLYKKFIAHSNKEVRSAILEKIYALDDREFFEILSQRVKEEKNEEVFATLLKTYGKIGRTDALSFLMEYINSSNKALQVNALVALFQNCKEQGKEITTNFLKELFHSNDHAKTLVALEVLRGIGVENFKTEFSEALNSDNFSVRKNALELVGDLQLREYKDVLLQNLTHYRFRNVTLYPLMNFKEEIFQDLKELFLKNDNLNDRLAIIKILGNMKSDEANKFLLQYIKEPLLMDTILDVLFKQNYISSDPNVVHQLLEYMIKHILVDLLLLHDFDKKRYPNSYLVYKELVDKKINNIFLILGFTYSKKTLSEVKNFTSLSEDLQAYSVELIDNLLPNNLKEIVLPILEQSSVEEKLYKYSEQFLHTHKSLAIEEKLAKYSQAFLEGNYKEGEFFSSFVLEADMKHVLKISLLYEIGKNQDKSYEELIHNALETNFSTIKETAKWAWNQLHKRT